MIYYLFAIIIILITVFVELPVLDYFDDLRKAGLSKQTYHKCIFITILFFGLLDILLCFIFSGIVFCLNTK